MSPEFGMQAASIGFNLIDGLGNMWADKVREKKVKEDLQAQRELEESYRERMLGPGQGGGFSEHLANHDQSNLKYFMPAIQSAAEIDAYQLATNVPNWFNKKAAKDVNATNNPNNINGEGLSDIPIAAAGSGNPDVQNKIGMQNNGAPTGMPWPGNILTGSVLPPDYDFASIDIMSRMMRGSKGMKLIPRKN